jgi:hypothetical protein
MSSIPFDWYSRRLVELHFTFEILNRVPVPRPEVSDPRRQRIVELAGRLAARDERYAIWASAVGVPFESVTTAEQRTLMEAEIDALVAHLYGLSRTQLSHIFATFHRGWSFRSRLDATLAFFNELGEPT